MERPSLALELLLLSCLLAGVSAAPSRASALLAAANPLDVASGDVPDIDREQVELRYFRINFTLPNITRPCRDKRADCSQMDLTWHMEGYVPNTGGSYPAYLFVSGAGPWTNEIRCANGNRTNHPPPVCVCVCTCVCV
jgi:hypothetical protein